MRGPYNKTTQVVQCGYHVENEARIWGCLFNMWFRGSQWLLQAPHRPASRRAEHGLHLETQRTRKMQIFLNEIKVCYNFML